MKKIAILTLNGYFNYGNRLQNYALQKYLENMDMDMDVTTIWLDKSDITLKRKFKNFVLKFLKMARRNSTSSIREEKFKEFSRKYINETNKSYNIHSNLKPLNMEYDYFVIGSDQVWNPSMNRANGAYFADFSDESKRISYSASFGISKLPESVQSNYKRWIEELAYISVRETDGKNIIKELTNRDSEVLIDPTLLLDKVEWEMVSSSAPKYKEAKYLLTYFLGELPKNVRKDVEFLSNKYNLEVINLGDKYDNQTYETGPAEFLDYINNCEIFLTDSFHGAAFSINLEKPFIVYERLGSENMFSRIATLLEMFKLEDRFINNLDIHTDVLKIDFTQARNILNIERKKSYNFLQKAILNK